MGKYILKRFLHGLLSAFVVVAIVMIMIYSMLDRNLIFAADNVYRNLGNNQKTVYQYRKWQEYGYINLLTYTDYLKMLAREGEIDQETREKAASIAKKEENDSELVAVIAAAIAAFEGTSAEGLVVRSIKRRGSRKQWQRA